MSWLFTLCRFSILVYVPYSLLFLSRKYMILLYSCDYMGSVSGCIQVYLSCHSPTHDPSGNFCRKSHFGGSLRELGRGLALPIPPL